MGVDGAQSDGGDDSNQPQIRPPISRTLWDTLRKLSPSEGIAAPTDSTNRYAQDERAVALGHYMFYEPEISGNGEISCASCHLPDHSFSGRTPIPVEGITGVENAPQRHTPTLLNAAYQNWYFWDGRVDTLWGQAVQPYESPIEMGGSRLKLAHFVYDDAEVRRAYEDLFGPLPERSGINPFPEHGRPIASPANPDEIAQNEAWESMRPGDQEKINQILVNVVKSLAAFELQLVATRSDFDRFVDEVRENPSEPQTWSAISASAQEGARLYVEVAGCLECHNGPLLTDGEFHNIGVPLAPWANPRDEGRHAGIALAKSDPFGSGGPYSDDPDGNKAQLLAVYPVRPGDLGAFRTPSLRDVSRRPPYMNAGQIKDLDAVMDFYNEPDADSPIIGTRSSEMSPLKMSEEELDHIVEFMKSLDSDPVPAKFLSAPEDPFP